MGTRHLTAVKLDGEYKIAQYGQWDGYPSGQGETVLSFLAAWSRPTFETKLRAASFLTEAETAAINAQIKAEGLEDNWQRRWPALTRDAGAEILQIVHDAPPGIKLKNSIGFAGDSLFCEWAYVIDLDANTLEVFRGFNKEPLNAGERFAKIPDLEKTDGYHPVRRIAGYPIDQLPTLQKLIEDCDPPEAEAAA